ncbi:MAG: hypothetical protein AAF360_14800, partial [Pseudomonadota bacterium]
MDRVSRTVAEIYNAVTDQRRWPDILDRIAEEVGARGCIIFERGPSAGPLGLKAALSSNLYEDHLLQDYIDQHRELELRDHAIFAAHSAPSDGLNIVGDEVLYEDLQEFRSRAQVKHVLGFGLLHRAAALLNKDNADTARFSVQFG